jgi:hypothetical protein
MDANVDCDCFFLFRPTLSTCVDRYLKDTDISLLDKIKVGILELDAIKVGRVQ